MFGFHTTWKFSSDDIIGGTTTRTDHVAKEITTARSYGKIYTSSYICHKKRFYRQLNYNHGKQLLLFEKITTNKNKTFHKSFFVSLECQTRRNFSWKKVSRLLCCDRYKTSSNRAHSHILKRWRCIAKMKENLLTMTTNNLVLRSVITIIIIIEALRGYVWFK